MSSNFKILSGFSALDKNLVDCSKVVVTNLVIVAKKFFRIDFCEKKSFQRIES